MAFSLNSSLERLKSPSEIAKLLFGLALFVLPFQVFTIVDQPVIYLSGQLNQFQNATIYITDILIILSAVFFIPTIIDKKIKKGNGLIFLSMMLLGVITLVLNQAFSPVWLIFRMLVFAIFYLLIINEILDKKTLWQILLVSGGLQAGIAIIQFINQSSLGLSILGEPNLGSAGIAKIDLSENKIIRSYGTTSHPNVLAGFLAIIVICSLWMKKRLYLVALCLAGIAFTFSRSAILALNVVAIMYAATHLQLVTKFFKKYILLIIGLGIVTAIVLPITLSHFTSTYEITERIKQYGPTAQMVIEYPLGVGWQNFTTEIQTFTEEKLKPWEYQPIHNIYMLATAELGVLGIVIMIFIGVYSFMLAEERHIKYAIIAIAIIALFDHYFYTLYLGQMLALLLVASTSDKVRVSS